MTLQDLALVAALPLSAAACLVGLLIRSARRSDRLPDSVPIVLTDRAQLLNNPTAGDHCRAFVHTRLSPNFVTRDCMTDGHYLCSLCARKDPDHPER